jgi:hypothetical protein
MAKQSAFACDGPKCDQLTPRKAGEKGAPQQWTRLTLRAPGSDDKSKIEGAFCSTDCAHDWLDDLLDTPVIRTGGQTLDDNEKL